MPIRPPGCMEFVIFGIELGDMRENSRQAPVSAVEEWCLLDHLSKEEVKGMAGGCSKKPVWESHMNLADGFVECDCTAFTIFLHKTDNF